MDSEDTIIGDTQRLEPGLDVLIHGYRLGQVLGRGAQGTVYQATVEGDPQSYAVKLVDIRHQPAQTVDRLVRECELTAKLDHPGIVRVYEAGYWGDHIFIVMETALGRAADRFAGGALGWRRAVEIARQAAVALAYAYDTHGVIHRDIKPANLVIELNGRLISGVKIVDFGLSRTVDDQIGGLTMTGAVMGTPSYISPEQARGERQLTFHTDMYALGASLFWMIAGRAPFSVGTPIEVLLQHCSQPAPNLRGIVRDCPAEVAEAVDRCLAKAPERRFEAYGRLIAEFEHLLDVDPAAGDLKHESSGFLHRAVIADPLPRPSVQRFVKAAPSPSPRSVGTGFKVKPRPVVERPPSLAPGVLIDQHFTVTGALGAGAMGEVYAIEDRVINHQLAMKILSDEDMDRPGAVRRFQGECTALATVEHRAFPYFAGKGTFRDRDYLLMERVKGVDLKTWLETNGGKMGEAGALQVVQQLAEAMHRAYGKCGMVHRDIKPANLMFTRVDGEAVLKIIDFGISTYIDYGDFEDFSARAYHYIEDDSQGRSVGTPAYMSPEQCVGAPPSPFMDIYAIGCTFFHLVTGRTPYQARNAAMVMISHMQEPPPTFDGIANIGKGSQYLLKRCVAKNPKDRFQNYAQIADAAKSAFLMTKTTRIFRPS